MARFIALDPSSTVTGWAAFQDDDLVAWGKINTQGCDYAGRFSYIVDELASVCVKYHAREIAVEDVKFAWHSKNRNRNIAGLQIVFRSISEWAKSIGLPLTAYNPATWKNSIVGHVNASKETTKENLCLRFPSLPRNLTDHEYDAIAIGVYHAALVNQRVALAVLDADMAVCVKCGNPVEGSKGRPGFSLCQDCAGKAADGASRADRLALAKTGIDALIDEATGFQDVRPKGDLAKRMKKYQKGG